MDDEVMQRALLFQDGRSLGIFGVKDSNEAATTSSVSRIILLEAQGHCYRQIYPTDIRGISHHAPLSFRKAVSSLVAFRNRYSVEEPLVIISSETQTSSFETEKTIHWPIGHFNFESSSKEPSHVRSMTGDATLTLEPHKKSIVFKHEEHPKVECEWLVESQISSPNSRWHIPTNVFSDSNLDQKLFVTSTLEFINTSSVSPSWKPLLEDEGSTTSEGQELLSKQNILRLVNSISSTVLNIPVAVEFVCSFTKSSSDITYHIVSKLPRILAVIKSDKNSVLEFENGIFTHGDIKFCSDTVPPSSEYFSSFLNIQTIVSTMLMLFEYNSGVCRYTNNNTDRIERSPLSNIVKESHRALNGDQYTAFEDGRVRVVFHDRTILELSFDQSKVSLVLPNATCTPLYDTKVLLESPSNDDDRVRYTLHALDFQRWANSTPEERITNEAKNRLRKRLVDIERFRYSGIGVKEGSLDESIVVPSVVPTMVSPDAELTSIENACAANQKMIDQINSCLQ